MRSYIKSTLGALIVAVTSGAFIAYIHLNVSPLWVAAFFVMFYLGFQLFVDGSVEREVNKLHEELEGEILELHTHIVNNPKS